MQMFSFTSIVLILVRRFPTKTQIQIQNLTKTEGPLKDYEKTLASFENKIINGVQ